MSEELTEPNRPTDRTPACTVQYIHRTVIKAEGNDFIGMLRDFIIIVIVAIIL